MNAFRTFPACLADLGVKPAHPRHVRAAGPLGASHLAPGRRAGFAGCRPGLDASGFAGSTSAARASEAATLLLICGEELSRRVLKVVLEATGYRVVEAVSVAEGMRHCAPLGRRPQLAVVVAGLGGGIWASLDLLRSVLVKVPLLVMSPEEVAWLLDTLDGREQGPQGQWLARVRLVLQEGCSEGLPKVGVA